MNTKSTDLSTIYQRKNRHLETVLSCTVEETPGSAGSGAGWDDFVLPHAALPELSLEHVDTGVEVLGRKLSMPLLISPTTGGTPDTYVVLTELAKAAEQAGVAIGVGSQRIALENPELAQFFDVRRLAPSVPLLANLGAVQLNYGLGPSDCQRVVDMIGADALVLHLNVLQECLQPGGNTDFSGLLGKIGDVCTRVSVPVIVKEVGFGIGPEIAKRLAGVGVAIIDIAGAGGTDWAKVEALSVRDSGDVRDADGTRFGTEPAAACFAGWGTPTAHLLAQYGRGFTVPLIASGGVRNGVHVAKALAMGAAMTGIALPLVRAAQSGAEAVVAQLERARRELSIAMLCAGCSDVREMRRVSAKRS